MLHIPSSWVSQEEWDLSICLLHRMFGGDCLPSDFMDSRPTFSGDTTNHEYNTSVLDGYDDPVDRLLYNGAKEQSQLSSSISEGQDGSFMVQRVRSRCPTHQQRFRTFFPVLKDTLAQTLQSETLNPKHLLP